MWLFQTPDVPRNRTLHSCLWKETMYLDLNAYNVQLCWVCCVFWCRERGGLRSGELWWNTIITWRNQESHERSSKPGFGTVRLCRVGDNHLRESRQNWKSYAFSWLDGICKSHSEVWNTQLIALRYSIVLKYAVTLLGWSVYISYKPVHKANQAAEFSGIWNCGAAGPSVIVKYGMNRYMQKG